MQQPQFEQKNESIRVTVRSYEVNKTQWLTHVRVETYVKNSYRAHVLAMVRSTGFWSSVCAPSSFKPERRSKIKRKIRRETKTAARTADGC